MLAETKTLDAVALLRADMQGEMGSIRLEMEGLAAQNQLLLSKISALSSQNKAPGLFAAADRRKLEERQEKLRRGGQKVAPAVSQRQLAFFDMLCKFFDATFLFLDIWSFDTQNVTHRSNVADPGVDVAAVRTHALASGGPRAGYASSGQSIES